MEGCLKGGVGVIKANDPHLTASGPLLRGRRTGEHPGNGQSSPPHAIARCGGSARCAVIPAQAGIQLTLCVNLCNKSKNYTSRLCRLDTARPRYDELPRLATLSQSTPSFCADAQKRRGMSGIIIIHQPQSRLCDSRDGCTLLAPHSPTGDGVNFEKNIRQRMFFYVCFCCVILLYFLR